MRGLGEVEHLLRAKGSNKPGSLLKSKIPIRLTQWDTSEVGYVEMDLVVHCGSSTRGEYINTVSTTPRQIGAAGERVRQSWESLRSPPFDWKGLDSDNGGEFINDILYKYCQTVTSFMIHPRPVGGLPFDRV